MEFQLTAVIKEHCHYHDYALQFEVALDTLRQVLNKMDLEEECSTREKIFAAKALIFNGATEKRATSWKIGPVSSPRKD